MKLAICDDSVLDRQIVRAFLERYFDERSILCSITEFESGQNLAFEIEDGGYFDIVILDIYMDGMTGIDTARRLRTGSFDGKIVFLTVSAEHAVESYDVAASGYILKPHSYERLSETMDRVLQGMEHDCYTVRSRRRILQVPLTEILYFESDNTKCYLNRTDGSMYTAYKRLGDIQQELNDPRFLRCHQSYLVNIRHITGVDEDFILDNGQRIPISQRRHRQMREEYYAYIARRAAAEA